jgi:hypothetical protein
MAKKIRSGGGITSNKLIRPGIKAGSPRTNLIDPHGPDFLGQSTSFPKPPLMKGTAPQVELGNALATNVGAGGPGQGRTVMRGGSQGTHGPTTGSVQQGRDILSEYGPEKSRG